MRQATSVDLDALERLEKRCFSYDQIGRRSFARLLKSPSAFIWVIDNDNSSHQIAAYAIILTRRNSRIWRLYSMATDPDARGKGLARYLLSELLTRAAAQKYLVRLEVKCTNNQALNLYRQLGFEVIDLLPGYYSDGDDGYRMQCSEPLPVARH